MKTVILAGGFGTRIGEETHLRPKPMVEIGGKPILWHILKTYSASGINDFIICLGYKGYMIKEYFANYVLHNSDVTFDMEKKTMEVHRGSVEPWKVTLVETGEHTMTGGRIKRVKPYLDNDTFLLTYGDGIADMDIRALIDFHKKHGRLATITAVQPPGRFGALRINVKDSVLSFEEKPAEESGYINGGFFALEPAIFDYIKDDSTSWESEPLEELASNDQLMAYRHPGFWQPMDTMRDKDRLEKLWQSGKPPWKVW